MKGLLHFAKMEGCGNDFVVLNDFNSRLMNSYSGLAKKLCERKYSVGADGLLVLKKSKVADIKMKYYNSDGSLASFCGNGARCISYYAYKKNITKKKFSLESDAGIVQVQIKKNTVKLGMTEPKDITTGSTLEIDGRKWTLDSINTGVPHAVVLLEQYKGIDVNDIGKKIRYHKQFQPAGTNVDFVIKKDAHNLIVRTYERGVESETLACGTGCVASTVIAGLRDLCESPVNCKTTGGEILKVYFKKVDGDFRVKDVFLEGSANISFEGEVRI